MKLQLVPAGQGLAWVRSAFRVFGRQPLGFAALFAACLFVFLLLGVIPAIGTAILLMLPPAGSLLFMIASERVSHGRTAMPGAIVDLVSSGRRRLLGLLLLGVAYAASTFVAFWFAGVLDGGALEAFFESLPDRKSTPDTMAARMADPMLQFGILLRLAFAAALSVPFWHAPALVHWGDQPWAKSLFFSTVAIWRNKAAFAIYGLAWAVLWLALLVLVSLGVGLLGPQRFTLVATPLTLIFSTIFYASLWFTFADCFAPTEAAPPDTPAV
ncbi:MAG TPA: BPSS1780 family membrane protein [Caldimonas sp.]|jgi:hypothetical protein|nr:BPSS1780 family membrane protein [Caldimonas sp.]HEX2539770.1 BPSS1780 family membrane protein [Caldimonas sp.]